MKKITPEELFTDFGEWPLLDVRTPAEYAEGHVPGALNLPLFSNDERVVVGTLYKQTSPKAAFLKGLEYSGARMPWYVTQAQALAPAGKAVVHCWRGGQRSGSLSWLLSFSGMEIMTLQGGYKAYRNLIHEQFFKHQLRPIVLGGPTGSGKTQILHELANKGEQIIDLEAIAHHKGSAFGALGEGNQPTVEQFENDLYQVFSAIDVQRRVWIENESKSIGRVYQPEGFWQQFKKAVLIDLQMPIERRIIFLVEIYATFPKADLMAAFLKIYKKLGGVQYQQACDAIEHDDYVTAAEIALRYYDKSYRHSNEKCNFDPIFPFPITESNFSEIAEQLIEFANQHGL
jgi:tRNA 2-selenouridine synthase